MTVVNPKSISGINSITMASGSDDLLTIHSNNTTERVRVNNSGDVIIGSGVTLSPDGDIFATGITTISENLKVGTGITFSPDGDIFFTGIMTGDGSQLTGLQAGKFVTDGVGITTSTPVGIETTSLARKDLVGPAGNTSTGAGSSFHGAYMGDGFLSFNTEFSNPTGYYISTFTNALVAGPMQLGTTLTIDGNFTIV